MNRNVSGLLNQIHAQLCQGGVFDRRQAADGHSALEHGHSFARATILEPVHERHRPGTDKNGARHGERVRIQEQER